MSIVYVFTLSGYLLTEEGSHPSVIRSDFAKTQKGYVNSVLRLRVSYVLYYKRDKVFVGLEIR